MRDPPYEAIESPTALGTPSTFALESPKHSSKPSAMGRDYGGAEAPEAPLLARQHGFSYVRSPRDRLWAYLYLLSLVGTIAGGVYALVHRNPQFATLYTSDYLRDKDHCPASTPPGRRLLAEGEGDDIDPSLFLHASGLVVGVSVVGGVLLGLASLALFKHRPHFTVGFTVGLQVVLPLSVAAVAFAAGASAAAWPFLFMAGVLALTFWLYREQLVLVGRLLSVGTRALGDNPGVVGAAMGLQLAGFVLVLPLLAAMFAGYTNGYVAPNPLVASIQEDGTCVDGEGKTQLCCAWQVEGWVPFYLAFTAVMLSWTSLLAFTMRLYTIAGATAQWYFAPVGQPGAAKGTVLRSLRYALGPSFGSLCLGSWVLVLIQYIRAMLQQIQEQAQQQGNFCASLLASCIDMLYALLQQLSKFGIVVMSMTGEGFFDGCRHAVDLLTRNLLDTVAVWWFPGMILQSTAFILAAAWGALAGYGSAWYWGGDHLAATNGIIVGVVAFIFGLLTLSFINGILLNIVDAVYICYAMDKDAGACTMVVVHEVYSQLPSNKGGVVENPDGEWRFGAAGTSHPNAPQPYPVIQQPGVFAPPQVYPQLPRV